MKQLWVIYDERAQTVDTDNCAVLESCSSLKECLTSCFDGTEGPLGVVFVYDIENGNELVNERKLGTVAELRARK